MTLNINSEWHVITPKSIWQVCIYIASMLIYQILNQNILKIFSVLFISYETLHLLKIEILKTEMDLYYSRCFNSGPKNILFCRHIIFFS